MQMKIVSLLVLVLAFLSEGHSSALVNTIGVLTNLEQTEYHTADETEKRQEKETIVFLKNNLVLQKDTIQVSNFDHHDNFPLDRLTCYFSSRLRN
jgi:hypothetical protein